MIYSPLSFFFFFRNHKSFLGSIELHITKKTSFFYHTLENRIASVKSV